MKSLQLLGLWLVLAAVPLAVAQNRGESDDETRDGGAPGFWFTPKMLDLGLDRLVDEMDDVYHFDDEQYMAIRKAFHERVPKALSENRGAVVDLFNGYMEAYLDREPPDSQYVADWAEKALPRLQVLKDTVYQIADDMRPVLNDEQTMLLEGQLAGFDAATSTLNDRLTNWAEGNFDADTEWHRSPNFKKAEAERVRRVEMKMVQAHQAAIAKYRGEEPPPTIEPGADTQLASSTDTKPKDEWAQYVQAMIEKYELDTDQQQRAWQYYNSATADRDRYLRRRLPDMDNVEQSYKNADDEEQQGHKDAAEQLRKRAEATLAEIDADVATLFDRFKEKLETIPRRAQRRAAAEREAEKSKVTE